jgi:hypothetical protein
MPNENTYIDSNYKPNEIPQNADYVHNPSTPVHCCDNDKCECHHPLRLWAIKYEVSGVTKFSGVAVVQAKDLCNAQYVFIQNSKFNGFREYIHILCIEELYPNPEPVLLLEDSAAIIDRRNLKSYPFLLKSDYENNIQNISDNVIEAVEDYIEHNPIQQVQSNWNETDETSKAYILNKPEIPDAQVQADWNESNESSKAFIQNKPTIPEAQVNADWNSESGKSQILNKPTDLVRKSDIEGLLRNDGTVYTGKYLEQVDDLDNFQASEGKIVQYIGETNSKYTNGFNYKKVGTQIVIPSGTDYINVNGQWVDSDTGLSVCGITRGIYYKTNETDEVSGNILKASTWSYTSGGGCINVYQDGNNYEIKENAIGLYWIGGSENTYHFLKVETVYYSTYQGIKYPRRIIYTDRSGPELYAKISTPIVQEFFQESDIVIFKSTDGRKIYCYNDVANNQYLLLALDYNGEHYKQVCDFLYLSSEYVQGVSQETIDIDTEEWQQCVPPEEDTSHYVTDSEIGWIEH